jgi:hypothetical protein
MKNVSMMVTFWTIVPLEDCELTALPPPDIFLLVVVAVPAEERVTDAEVASEVVVASAPFPPLPALADAEAIEVVFVNKAPFKDEVALAETEASVLPPFPAFFVAEDSEAEPEALFPALVAEEDSEAELEALFPFFPAALLVEASDEVEALPLLPAFVVAEALVAEVEAPFPPAALVGPGLSTALWAAAAAASPPFPSLAAAFSVVPLPETVNLVQSSAVPRCATGIKTP